MSSETAQDSWPDRPRTPIEVISRPFTYCEYNGLSVKGITRADPKELKLLFRANASRSRLREARCDWVKAQLELYGIPFSTSLKKAELMSTLEKAVKSGKCNKTPDSVNKREDELRRRHREALAEHHKAVKRWGDERFEMAKDHPDEQACLNLDRFMKRYFIDEEGKPDRSKTKDPLILRDVGYVIDPLQLAVDKVPGLRVHKKLCMLPTVVGWDTEFHRGVEEVFNEYGRQYGNRNIPDTQASYDLDLFLKKYFHLGIDGIKTDNEKPSTVVVLGGRFTEWSLLETFARATPRFCVKYRNGRRGKRAVLGWEAEQVSAKIEELRMEEQREIKEEEGEEKAPFQRQMDDFMKPHREYIEDRKPYIGELNLSQLPGSYRVKCDWLEEGYGREIYDWGCEMMTINIFPAEKGYGVKASFVLEIIEGVMLLALSREDVVRLREAQPKKEDKDEDKDGDENEEDDKDKVKVKVEDEDRKDKSAGEKRPIGSISDPWGVQAARAKRQKAPESTSAPAGPAQNSHPNRVYLQFAYNDVNGYPSPDDRNRNVGYFNFDMATFTAEGLIYLKDWTDEPLKMTLHKTSDTPALSRTSLREWYEYDSRTWGNRR